MPHIVKWHDGTVYFVSAKSLAGGEGYKIRSLPFEPYQTKYPPLYPALLSLVWRINPVFPANLTLATMLSWCSVPLLIAAFLALCRRYGLARWESWTLGFFLAWNACTVFYGISLLSEVWFTALLLICLLWILRAGDSERAYSWALAAGVCGAAAYLTRSAGMMLLPAGIIWFVFERRLKHALVFATPSLLSMAAWNAWAIAHQARAIDTLTSYYTSYFGYQLRNVDFGSLGLVMTRNFQELFNAAGSLLFADMEPSWPIVFLRVGVALFVLGGAVRWMIAQRRARAYGYFAAGSLLIQIVWHFPPNERFLFPLLPLLLLGGMHECRHGWRLLRRFFHSEAIADRILSRTFAGAGAAAIACCVSFNAAMIFRDIPELLQQYRVVQENRAGAYDWIRTNVPADANVFSDDDPLLYLYTGHRSAFLPVLPIHWYRGAGVEPYARAYSDFGAFARQYELRFALLTNTDFTDDMGREARAAVFQLFAANPDLIPKYEGLGATIYRVHSHDVRE
jgi:hypothetical protein